MKKIALFLLFMIAVPVCGQPSATDKVYRTTEVDSKPDLENGMYSLTMFVSQNYVFPPELKNKKIRIFTSFIIEPDGSMSDIKSFFISVKDYLPSDTVAILTEAEKAAENQKIEAMKTEAARVLKNFGQKWQPATISGKPVRCLYNYPISFNIE